MRRVGWYLIGFAIALGVFGWFLPTPAKSAQNGIPLQPVATVAHPPIDEMSGIARSRTYPDVYWVHNDSGDRARLFAIRQNGAVIVPPFVSRRDSSNRPESAPPDFEGVQIEGATNIDWEDIAIDGDTLYIADTGNNFNARRDLAIYVLKEPNPRETVRTHVLKRIPVAYPDQKAFPPEGAWRYDCEALFVFQGKLYLLTKHRPARQPDTPDPSTTLYRLDSEATDRINTLTKVDEHPNLGGWVTAAAMSPDEQVLAVLCQAPQQSVWLFQRPPQGDRFLSEGKATQIRFTNGKQCEAIEWVDNETLIITNEQREIFVIKVSR